MANTLQAVQTYQKSGLGILQNMYCFISTANKKFKDFDKLIGNLGSTATFDLPVRMVSRDGLVVNTFDPVVQRVQSLTVDKARNVNLAFTAQELIFNIENNNYEPELARSAMAELGSYIEADVASVIPSATYRFYGTPSAPVNSYGALAQAIANYQTFGAVNGMMKGYLDLATVPQIVNTGLNQFALNRNNTAANSWEVGNYARADWYQSNLLPIHFAGNVGNDSTTLTVVSINGAGDQITFSGASVSDTNAIKANDLFQFQDVGGSVPNIRFRHFTGHTPSNLPVQFRATANAASDGSGNVVVSIDPALIATDGSINQNVTIPVAAGMQVQALADHTAGLLLSGDGMYLAMPTLPDQSPFITANQPDMESGASIRFTTGAVYTQNTYGSTYDCIWGKTIARDYGMRLIFAA